MRSSNHNSTAAFRSSKNASGTIASGTIAESMITISFEKSNAWTAMCTTIAVPVAF
jgi:hypothetical protein